MLWIAVVIGIAALLFGVWVLSLKGETRDLSALDAAPLAHRGLHNTARPENSLAAFEAAFARGYGAELDVHLTADGALAVMHDRSLLRMVGADRDITALTAAELKTYTLAGSDEPIPFLEDVLTLAGGRVPLLIELKADSGNHAALCEAVCRALDGYRGTVALESFDPRCLLWLRRHRPDLVRGQLSQDFCRSKDVHPLLRVLLTSLLTNALTRPHFIAYRHDHRASLPLRLGHAVWHTPTAFWTLTTREAYDESVAAGAVPIFEGFEP